MVSIEIAQSCLVHLPAAFKSQLPGERRAIQPLPDFLDFAYLPTVRSPIGGRNLSVHTSETFGGVLMP